MRLGLFAAITFAAATLACGGKKNSPKAEAVAGGTAVAPTAGTGPATSPIVTVPAPTAVAGQLVIEIATADLDAASLEGFVVGQEGAAPLKPAGGDTYYIDRVPPGKLDVVISGKRKVARLGIAGEAGAIMGRRINNIVFTAGTATTLGEKVTLPTAGSVSGRAFMTGATDNTGISVYIPGTHYAARTNADGQFALPGLPVGDHDLQFEREGSGFTKFHVDQVTVNEGQDTPVPAVELVFNHGITATIAIQLTDLTAAVAIGVTEGAPTHMIISDDPTFANQQYEPFAATKELVLPVRDDLRAGHGKAKRIVAAKLKEGGLEVTVTQEVAIDLFADRAAPVLGEGAATYASAVVPLALNAPHLATSMQVSLDPEFVNAEWTPVAATVPVTFLSDGEVQVFVRFRTVDDVESDVASASIVIATPGVGTPLSFVTNRLSGANAPRFVLGDMSAYGPDAVVHVATNAEFTEGAVTFDATSGGAYEFPDDGSACGPHDVYLKVVNATTGYTSPETAVTLSYDCWQAVTTENGTLARYYSSILFMPELQSLIVWGGQDADGDGGPSSSTGKIYSLDRNSWKTMTTEGAPQSRHDHRGVWTGKALVVFGGRGESDEKLGDGGVYEVATDTWRSLPAAGAPSPRDAFEMVWTGDRVLVWGGEDASGCRNDGAMYDPANDVWIPMNPAGAPSCRNSAAVVWTGSELVVWGGFADLSDEVATGGRFSPGKNEWTPMAATSLTPRARMASHVVGGKVMVWGGSTTGLPNNDGAIYDLATDQWTLMGTAGAQPGPASFSDADPATEALFRGEFVVWGAGDDVWGGARYSFADNTWRALPTGGATPKEAAEYRFLTAGGELLLSTSPYDDSPADLKRYDAEADAWRPLPASPLDPWTSARLVFGDDQRIMIFGGYAADRSGAVADGAVYFATKAPVALTDFHALEAGDARVSFGREFNVGYTAIGGDVRIAGGTLSVEEGSVVGPVQVVRASAALPDVEAGGTTAVSVADADHTVRLKVTGGAKDGDRIAFTLAYHTADGTAGKVRAYLTVAQHVLSAVAPTAAPMPRGVATALPFEVISLWGEAVTDVSLTATAGTCAQAVIGSVTAQAIAAQERLDGTVTVTSSPGCSPGATGSVVLEGSMKVGGGVVTGLKIPVFFTVGAASAVTAVLNETLPAAIADDATPQSLLTFNVANVPFTKSVRLHVHFDHPYVGELTVTLKGPMGVHAELMYPNYDQGYDAAVIDRVFSPADFARLDSNGTWTLEVTDGWQDDLANHGMITAAELTLQGLK